MTARNDTGRLLARIDQTTREANDLGLRVKVDRLLESAAPSIHGMAPWARDAAVWACASLGDDPDDLATAGHGSTNYDCLAEGCVDHHRDGTVWA